MPRRKATARILDAKKSASRDSFQVHFLFSQPPFTDERRFQDWVLDETGTLRLVPMPDKSLAQVTPMRRREDLHKTGEEPRQDGPTGGRAVEDDAATGEEP